MKSFLVMIIVFKVVSCWNLSNWGFGNDYYVSSIAVYNTRVFLSLPRSICHNGIDYPSLVEIARTGDHFFVTPSFYNARYKILEHQFWIKCNDIQDAVSLSLDPRMPKLWILDKGNEYCQPKILSFNLFYNVIDDSCQLTNIPREKLSTLVIDRESTGIGYMAYIGNAGDNTILAFSLNDLKWWRLKLVERSNPTLTVKADFLAVSKTKTELFITGNEGTQLFSLDLEDIINSEVLLAHGTQKELVQNVTLLGDKLGESRGLEADVRGGLSYYMTRDYAVVRWNVGLPLQAESYNVLAQSYERLPYVSQLFTGPQNGLWAVVNPLGPEECVKSNTTYLESVPKLDNRVVKIMKYNIFSQELENCAI